MIKISLSFLLKNLKVRNKSEFKISHHMHNIVFFNIFLCLVIILFDFYVVILYNSNIFAP